MNEWNVVKIKRALRVLEEAYKLAQACGVPQEQALEIQSKVYSQSVVETPHAVGGVASTLFALAKEFDLTIDDCIKDYLDKEIKLVRSRIEETVLKNQDQFNFNYFLNR